MADEPKTPPEAAADKPASDAPAEPLKGEVSRTDAPGAGVSAAPTAPPRQDPPAPKPANPAAAQTATTSETSSATGQPSPPAQATVPKTAAPAAAARPAAAAAPAAKPAAPAAPKPAAGAAPHPPAAAPPSGPTDPPPPADKSAPPYLAALQTALPGAVTAVSYYLGDWTIIVAADKILEVARHLRDSADGAFDFCADVTAVDWPPRKEARFDVVYVLFSTRHRHRLRVKAHV